MIIQVTLITALITRPVWGVYQDLTWEMDPNRISYAPAYYDDKHQFNYTSRSKLLYANQVYVAHNTYSTAEHVGTHIDAPAHLDQSGKSVDEIPLEDLIGPLVKIDISHRAEKDPDAIVFAEDLENWEARNGRIPDGSFVLMSSGYDRYYGDDAKYTGRDDPHDAPHLPGFGEQAAKWLKMNRNVKGVGVDTLSCDAGNSNTLEGEYFFPVHQILLPAGIICVENLRSLDKVPECGARFSVFPIMLKNGTGSQSRAFAEWYDGVGYMTHCKGKFKEGTGTFSMNGAPESCSSAGILLMLFTFLFVIHH